MVSSDPSDHEGGSLLPTSSQPANRKRRSRKLSKGFFLSNAADGRDAFESQAIGLNSPRSSKRASVLPPGEMGVRLTPSEEALVKRATRHSIFREEELVKNPSFAKKFVVGLKGAFFQFGLILLTIMMFSGGPILINFAHAVPSTKLNIQGDFSVTDTDFLTPRGWEYQQDCQKFRIATDSCFSDQIAQGVFRKYTGALRHIIHGDFTFFLSTGDGDQAVDNAKLTLLEADGTTVKEGYGIGEPIFLRFDGDEFLFTVEYSFPPNFESFSDDQKSKTFLEMKYLRYHEELTEENLKLAQRVSLDKPMDWHDYQKKDVDWKTVPMKLAKGNVYLEATMIASMYVAAWAIGIVWVLVLDIMEGNGLRYSKMSWDMKMVWLFAPASLGWSLADVCEVMAVGGINPTIFMVLLQMRLISTVICAFIFLGRNPNRIQWGVLVALNCCTLGFALANSSGGGGGGAEVSFFAYFMIFSKIALSTGATLYGEISFSKSSGSSGEPVPFMVQCNQICVVSAPVALVGIALTQVTPTPISQYGFFGGVDFGWDWRTYVVVLMYLTRNFVVNMCIKKFDATIKNICSASATIAVYVIGIMLNIERFAVHKIFSFVVLIALVGLFFQAENIEFHSAGDGLNSASLSATCKPVEGKYAVEQENTCSSSVIARQNTTLPDSSTDEISSQGGKQQTSPSPETTYPQSTS